MKMLIMKIIMKLKNNNLEYNNEDNNNTYKVKDRRWLPKRQFRKMNKEN